MALQIDFPLEQGEDNIIAHLKAKVAEYNLSIPTIAPLGTADQIATEMKRGACIYVVYESDYAEQRTDLNGQTFQEAWRVWRVYVWAHSLQARKAARRGTDGTYYVSDAVKMFLEGYDPVMDNEIMGETSYPMLFLQRSAATDEDLAESLMLMRFAHPIEVQGPML